MELKANKPHRTGQSRNPRRLGIFGGTFDPIHIGHLIVAEEAWTQVGLNTVLFVPARISPLKQGEGTMFTPRQRLEMVELAIADNSHFAVSAIDLEREGPSYTVDTLRALRDIYGEESELFFILGADSIETMREWHRPQEIIELTRLIALSRPGYELDLSNLETDLPGIAEATEIIETIEIGISSTDIRRRLCSGLSIRYQVPDLVERAARDIIQRKERGQPAQSLWR